MKHPFMFALTLLILLCLTSTSAVANTLTWKDNSNNETGFAIEILSGGTWTEVARVIANVTTFTDSNTEGVYRVRAFITVDGVDIFSGYSNKAAQINAPVSLTIK